LFSFLSVSLVGEVLQDAGVAIEIIDAGGGFPAAYADVAPPPLGAIFAEIEAGFERLGMPASPAVGRARSRPAGAEPATDADTHLALEREFRSNLK